MKEASNNSTSTYFLAAALRCTALPSCTFALLICCVAFTACAHNARAIASIFQLYKMNLRIRCNKDFS